MYLPVPWYSLEGVGLKALMVSENPARLTQDRLFCLCVLSFITESSQEDEFQETDLVFCNSVWLRVCTQK